MDFMEFLYVVCAHLNNFTVHIVFVHIMVKQK